MARGTSRIAVRELKCSRSVVTRRRAILASARTSRDRLEMPPRQSQDGSCGFVKPLREILQFFLDLADLTQRAS
jgi:hypothetical protein